jgi:GTP pyrophosphokinase
MVKVKENVLWSTTEGQVDLEQWLHHLENKGYLQDLDLLRNSYKLSQLAGGDLATETGISCLKFGLMMADVLADLEVDPSTLAAAILCQSAHYAELSMDDIHEQLGASIAKLVHGVEKMSAMDHMTSIRQYAQNRHHLDNIRKMLVAMVDDPRVVLLKLAERLCILRTCGQLSEALKQHFAAETMAIYAPLANRLGIGAIKWEMEDLAFRYLHPDAYKEIAKGLKTKRLDRDRYVNLIVNELNKKIKEQGVEHFAVYGRAKHIHSIYRKMMRKNVPLEAIYDATAVRILAETSEQCYRLLAMVHSLWQSIPAEYDDYITHPKENGYQSLHTAVIGPENRIFEVQIRTFFMHEFAEMGVAAHWKYKEGKKTLKESHERKINWLRDVLAWHKELALNKGGAGLMETEFLEDRIYLFTPDGDVIDLPREVTPLDFAYHIHSEVGHSCRGAKVNGTIVPLTYKLNTGDRVEILTGKESKPSRDWLNSQLGYIKTSRAKAKVLHWFKMQDYETDLLNGKENLYRELKSLGIKLDAVEKIMHVFGYKEFDDLLAAVGRGELKITQILSRIQNSDVGMAIRNYKPTYFDKTQPPSEVAIEGISHLLTYIAGCCKPLPGDEVIGYITVGRGVSVHRSTCSNVLRIKDKQSERCVKVSWSKVNDQNYLVDLMVKAFDRINLLKDLTAMLANQHINVQTLRSEEGNAENIKIIFFTVEISNINALLELIQRIKTIPNIIEVKRLLE